VARLVVEKGKDKGKTLLLKEAGGTFLVGRDLKTSLRLRDLQASRKHFQIKTTNGEVLLEDLDSSNGTYVNGERVQATALKPNDKIQVGETLIFYLEEESQDETGVSETQAVDTLAVTANRKGELTGAEVAGYRVGRLLGRGGMGTVYEAIQVSLERRVAFKVLAAELAADKQFVDRFTAEARAAGQLNHPNIVQVYDVGFSKDVRFYSMEFMAKGSVEDLLRQHGKLPVGHALAIAFDATRGLEYAERKGIVHRDIKPDNLMVSEDDVVKIGDLGIATRRRAEHEGPGDDGVSGSPHYIAPEQALGKAIDHRADLYALGVSLYEMLCGETPYEGSSAREVILKHLNEKAPPLGPRAPDVPPEVVSVVERLMEKEPARRPPSASALLQDLVPLLRRFPISESGASRVDGFLSKRLELSLQTSGPNVSGASNQPTTETSAVIAKIDTERSFQGDAEAGTRRARASLLALAATLGAIALGVTAFSIVQKVRVRAEQAREGRASELKKARDLLEKDPQACARAAESLGARFDEEGERDDALVARELKKEAEKRIQLAKEAHVRKLAEEALAQAKAELLDFPATVDDPEGVRKLERTILLLEKVAKDFPKTQAGSEAEKGRAQSQAELQKARATRDQRLADEAELKKVYDREAAAIEDFCSQGRFDDALTLVAGFDKEHGASEPGKKAVASLRTLVLEKVDATLDQVFRRAREKTKSQLFDGARELLRPLLAELAKLPDARSRVDAELRSVDESEHSQVDVTPDQRKRVDDDRLATAEQSARGALAQRQFEKAAEFFDDAAEHALTPAGREAAEWRAERLHLAASAVSSLLDFVKKRREKAAISKNVQIAGESVHYVAFDASLETLEIQFHDEKDATVTVTERVADLTPHVLHAWTIRAARGDGNALLACGALALETGRKDLAREDTDAAVRSGSLVASARARAKKLLADVDAGK
jgi:serine/threonine protein kinase